MVARPTNEAETMIKRSLTSYIEARQAAAVVDYYLYGDGIERYAGMRIPAIDTTAYPVEKRIADVARTG
jgi:hypothetical protein